MSSFFISLFSVLLFFLSGLLILLVLIQRGRGGGLAGAFGGQGGQSALGVRAGDVFTKITVIMAVCWVILCGGLGIAMRSDSQARLENTVLDLPSEEPADGEEDEAADTADEDAAAPPVFGDADAEDKPAGEAVEAEADTTDDDTAADADGEAASDGDSTDEDPGEDATKDESKEGATSEETEKSVDDK